MHSMCFDYGDSFTYPCRTRILSVTFFMVKYVLKVSPRELISLDSAKVSKVNDEALHPHIPKTLLNLFSLHLHPSYV